jgi:hypothetical protein
MNEDGIAPREILRALAARRVAFVALVVLANLVLGAVARGRDIAKARVCRVDLSDGGTDLWGHYERKCRELAADPVIQPWRWTRGELLDSIGWWPPSGW